MLLAGDVGGTKTLLGLFEPGERRPRPFAIDEFVTLEYDGLEAIIERFLGERRITPARISVVSVGVAGAVTDQVAQLTNVPWLVAASGIRTRFAIDRAFVLNDLEALAYAVPVLEGDELAVLQQGTRVASGNIAVIAAGTGLGESMLLNVEGRFVPGESEGGHADFAARTTRELELVAALTGRFGRAEVEHVLSGPGLVNLYQFTHDAFSAGATPSRNAMPAKLCAAVGHLSDPSELPARISAAATERRCEHCVEALDMFVSAYGAEAGNIALRNVATFGVYVGGGIAPRILPALRTPAFITAFLAKEPMDALLARIPVAVILNPQAGLLGAAVHANAVR